MPRSPTRRVACAVLFVCGLVLSSGCGHDAIDTVRVSRWSHRGNDTDATRTLELPVRLESPRDEERPTSYTLETEVRLPKRMQGWSLWFVVPELLAPSSLEVDGEPATALTGPEWDVAWTSGPHVFEIPSYATRDGSLSLRWSILRVWKPSDWIDTVPELHPEGELGRRASLALGSSLVAGSLAVGVAFMLAFAPFVMWVMRRDHRGTIYLALGAVFSGHLFAFQAGWFQLVAGTRTIHVVACAYALAVWANAISGRRWFGVRIVPRWYAVLFASVIISAVATWSRPSLAFVSTLPIAALCAATTLIAHAVVLRPGRPSSDVRSTTVWFGWVVFAVLGIPDLLYYTGFGEVTGGVRTASLGAFLWGCAIQHALMSARIADVEGTRVALEARALDARRENDALYAMKRDLERLAHADADAMLRVLQSTASHRKGPRLRVGATVDDRYEILGTLGAGGMGSVYEVRRVADDARLALKVAHDLDGETLARLAREAWVAATVRSDRVIAVHDVGVANEGYLFFVMERFPGVAASSCTARYGDVAWVTSVLAASARGLADLHDAGIVHRDLKPSNILVADTPEGTVAKIADFGISRFDATLEEVAGKSESVSSIPPPSSTQSPTPTPATTLTQVGAIAGTRAYMAPEVARGTTSVAREADIFGFGVIAYEMLVGVRPFQTSIDLEPMDVDGVLVAASIGLRDVEIDSRLRRTLDACLAIDPRARPTAKELVRAFEDVLKRQSDGSLMTLTSSVRDSHSRGSR